MPKVSEQLRSARDEATVLVKRAEAIHSTRAGRADAAATRDEQAQLDDIDRQLAALSPTIRTLQCEQDALIARAQRVDDEDPHDLSEIMRAARGITTMGRPRLMSPVAKAIHASGLLQALGPDAVGGRTLQLTLRTLLGGTVAPGVAIAPSTLPTTSGYASTYGRLLDVLPHIPVSGPSVLYNRLVFNPNTTGAGAAAVAQGVAKPHSQVDAVPLATPVETIATYEKISTQLIADSAQTLSMLETMLTQAVLDKADQRAYAVITTSGNYTPFAPAAASNSLDAAAQAAAVLAGNGATNIVVAINPIDYVAAGTLKATGSGVYIGAPPALAGVTLIQSATVAAGSLLGFDASGAGPAWADRESVTVALGLDGNDWTCNLRTALAELRGIAVVRDPRRVVFGPSSAAVGTTVRA